MSQSKKRKKKLDTNSIYYDRFYHSKVLRFGAYEAFGMNPDGSLNPALGHGNLKCLEDDLAKAKQIITGKITGKPLDIIINDKPSSRQNTVKASKTIGEIIDKKFQASQQNGHQLDQKAFNQKVKKLSEYYCKEYNEKARILGKNEKMPFHFEEKAKRELSYKGFYCVQNHVINVRLNTSLSNEKSRIKRKRQKVNKKNQIISCPRCKQDVRSGRFKNHIDKKCRLAPHSS